MSTLGNVQIFSSRRGKGVEFINNLVVACSVVVVFSLWILAGGFEEKFVVLRVISIENIGSYQLA